MIFQKRMRHSCILTKCLDPTQLPFSPSWDWEGNQGYVRCQLGQGDRCFLWPSLTPVFLLLIFNHLSQELWLSGSHLSIPLAASKICHALSLPSTILGNELGMLCA